MNVNPTNIKELLVRHSSAAAAAENLVIHDKNESTDMQEAGGAED